MNNSWYTHETDVELIVSLYDDASTTHIINEILFKRGLKDKKSIDDYLNPRMSHLHSPFLMKNMTAAVERLHRAITKNESIAVFADSDLDGLSSLTVLMEMFKIFKVDPYIRYPKDDEGYGLTNLVIDELIDVSIDLVVTVDSGIRDIEQINYAKSNGIDFIVTDHHEPDLEVPDAVVVDPKQKDCPYPFKDLAGVGVAFKFCQAYLMSYLPVYNKKIFIVNQNEDSTLRSVIEYNNGYVVNLYHEELNDVLNSHKNNGNIFLCDTPLVDFEDESSFVFTDFIGRFFQNKNDTLEKTAHYFKLNPDLYDYETLKIIILQETQFLSSPKLKAFIDSIIGYVAIGSVADIMPLVEENRSLVYFGLQSLNKTNHPGLSMLMEEKKITAKTIGWEISPILNSPGRFGETQLTVDFFLKNDREFLTELITKLNQLNNKRKRDVNTLIDEILNDLSKKNNDSNVVYYRSESIPDGFAGLIAGRLSDHFCKPVIIAAARDKYGFVKGSGRAPDNYKLFEYIQPFLDDFERIGGHSQAFGFTAQENQIDEIISKINNSVPDLDEISQSQYYDNEISLDEISVAFIESLAVLEPLGKGNEAPVFVIRNVKPHSFQKLGAESRHGKYIFKGNFTLDAIGWSMAVKMNDIFEENHKIDIIFTLEINSYLRKKTPQLILIDIIKSQ